jgi:hypothetical protein
MSLKDIIQNDISTIFFNTEEFAEPHNIDGRVLNIIVDNDMLMHRSKKEYDGITVGEILFYAKADDFNNVPPRPGTPMIFDNRQMYVFNVRENHGVYEIILNQNMGL